MHVTPWLTSYCTNAILVETDASINDNDLGDPSYCHALEDVEVAGLVVSLTRDEAALFRSPDHDVGVGTLGDMTLRWREIKVMM